MGPSPSRPPRHPKTPSDAIFSSSDTHRFGIDLGSILVSILAIHFPPGQPTKRSIDRLILNMARRNARSDPPPNWGRRAESLNPGLLQPSGSFQSQVPDINLRLRSPKPSPKPSPGGCAFRPAAPAFGRIRAFGASWPKKWRSKRPSKTDQILMPFQHRFLSVLAPFWRAKMAPKSIKNRSKLSFRGFLFPHRFLH